MKRAGCCDDSVLKKASSLRNKDYGTYSVCIPVPRPPSQPSSSYSSMYTFKSVHKTKLLPGLHQELHEK